MQPSKHKMTVLSQIFKLIPRNLIPKLANEFGIDRQSRVFSPTSHMLKEKNEIFRGDSLEIFISTYPNPLYREIIVNPRGDQFDAWHVTNPFGGFVTPKRRYEAPEIITIVRRQSDEFRLIVAVPWRLLPEYTRGGGPRSGERITFMLVRSDGAPGRETLYYSCYPLLGDGHNLNMHIQATLE